MKDLIVTDELSFTEVLVMTNGSQVNLKHIFSSIKTGVEDKGKGGGKSNFSLSTLSPRRARVFSFLPLEVLDSPIRVN